MLNISTMRWCEIIWPIISGKSYVGEAEQVNEEWSVGKHLKGTVALLIAVLVTFVGCPHRYHDAACTQRGAAYSTRVETLKREAHEKLKIGTKKDAVIRFFAENGIPVTFTGDEATGTIYTTGCAPSGCGSDAALIGVRVKIDEVGSVVAEPVVGAIYTHCL